MRRRAEEPLTINADVVASFLEQSGRPRMASFVRHLGDCSASLNRRIDELRARLDKYEPPQPYVRPASNRSEWD